MKKNKKIITFLFLFSFSFFRINNIVYADEFNMQINQDIQDNMQSNITNDDFLTNNSTLTDFNMDMMFDMGNTSMDLGYDVMDSANETNFMNHEVDNSLLFFFDSLDVYNNDMSFDNFDNVHNAIEDGNWSSSFNDQFNVDTNLVYIDVNTYDNQLEPIAISDENVINLDNNNDILSHVDSNTMNESSDSSIIDNVLDSLSNLINIQDQDNMSNLMDEVQQRQEEEQQRINDELERQKEEDEKNKEDDKDDESDDELDDNIDDSDDNLDLDLKDKIDKSSLDFINEKDDDFNESNSKNLNKEDISSSSLIL